jgi:hypothetical protein
VSVRNAVLGSIAVWAVIVLGTYLAGEQGEVAVVHTRDERGAEFTTKVWIVDLGDVSWIRVAKPDRDWYQRLLAQPRVEIERGGRIASVLAIPDLSREAALAVDQAFAEKYGLVDRWYGLLVRKGAVPIRLVPQTPDP